MMAIPAASQVSSASFSVFLDLGNTPLPRLLPVNQFLFGLLAAAFLLTGCGHDHAAHPGPGADPGVTFNTKKGLHVPPATAAHIGLKTAEASERPVASTLSFPAQVYRTRYEVVASGRVSVGDAARLSDGQKVTVQADGGTPIPARIEALKHGLAEASGEVEVLVTIPDGGGKLAAGEFLSVSATLGGGRNVMSVPLSSVFRTTEGNFVYTVSGDHFVRAPVKLGAVNLEFAEVTDGLYAGDQIVATPVMTLWMAELQSLRGGKACADGH